jgi:hypothetical protein
MKARGIILFAALAAAVAGLLITRQHAVRKTEPPPPELTKSSSPAPAITVPAPQAPPLAVASSPPPAPVARPPAKTSAATNASTQTEIAVLDQPITNNGYRVEDPVARLALYSVGTGDPEADAYWESAIFDPGLPAEERKDLIEDLNETGLADPQHPGSGDLPMILARIRLIEQLRSYSIDQVDANAFAEAEKDLVGMANGQAPQ